MEQPKAERGPYPKSTIIHYLRSNPTLLPYTPPTLYRSGAGALVLNVSYYYYCSTTTLLPYPTLLVVVLKVSPTTLPYYVRYTASLDPTTTTTQPHLATSRIHLY